MKENFYCFASSKAPQIDSHGIHEALDNWTWLWTWLESCFVFFACGIAIAVCASWPAGLAISGIAAAIFMLASPFFLWRARIYAIDQIREILKSPERRETIRANLNAIHR